MLTLNLLKHELIKSFRAQSFYRSLALKLLMGFMALYFITAFAIVGFALGNILEETNDTLKPLEVLNGASIYILLGFLLVRYFIQSLTVINLDHYISLPIKRNVLVNLTLLKPLFMPLNYIVLVVAIPFAFRSVLSWYSGLEVAQFLLNTVFLVWMNLWLVYFLKRRFSGSFWVGVVMLGIVVGLALLEYFKVFSLFALSVKAFGFLTITPFGFLVSLFLALLAYGLNRLFYSKNYYPEKFNEKFGNSDNKVTRGLSFLERYGSLGEMMQMHIKLIMRHKRTKSMLYMGAFFVFYGLLFYPNELYSENLPMLVFVAMILTGMLSIMFGQWAIGWDSNHFDGLLTKNISIKDYIKSYFFLMIAFNVFSFIVTSPYFYFGKNIAYMHTAMFFYNTGINVPLLLFFASFNSKRIDLMAKSSFNYQGTTMKNFLIVLPLMGLPALIVGVLGYFFSFEKISLVLGLIGIVGILFMPQLFRLTVKQFNRRKYVMAQGFREKE